MLQCNAMWLHLNTACRFPNGQASIYQGNQIYGFNCPAFETFKSHSLTDWVNNRLIRISLRWPIYIINSVDKTKFLKHWQPEFFFKFEHWTVSQSASQPAIYLFSFVWLVCQLGGWSINRYPNDRVVSYLIERASGWAKENDRKNKEQWI